MNPDTNDTIGLSRRTLLAGLGAVGVASAGAGLGTTAYFNDTESFEGNTLTAGELDLKLDYRATYAGGPLGASMRSTAGIRTSRLKKRRTASTSSARSRISTRASGPISCRSATSVRPTWA